MRVSLVSADDWQGLYFNGELRVEAHKVTFLDMLDIIIPKMQGYKNTVLYQEIYINQEWMEDRADLPDCLIDIPDSAILYIKNVEWQL